MPSRNVIREFVPESFYHVYNRGVEKRKIFLDEQDYTVFLGLLKKYITGETKNRSNRHPFKHFKEEIDILAYCLMPNHFHLLIYQKNQAALSEFMRRISTAYVMYFNDRYKRVGSLYQGPYKASRINADSYLQHISRYIHLNPKNYKEWPFSSLPYYAGQKSSAWVKPEMILELFDGDSNKYLEFVSDYQEAKQELDAIKWQLANDIEM